MTNTRLRKPLHDLTQTAFDLVLYLRHVGRAEFFSALKRVRDQYAAPKESWIWFAFYPRDRVSVLDKALEDQNKSVIETTVEILKEGGWEDTSLNTNLLRLLLKQLHGYDSEAILQLNEIVELKGLLVDAIEKRQVLEEKLFQYETKLKEIDSEKLKLEEQLLKTQQELLCKQEEIHDKESKLLALEETHSLKGSELQQIEAEKNVKLAELKDYQERLLAIQLERKKHEEELDAARTKLLLLNPEIDISKMDLKEIETLMTEAKRVGEEAARIYIKEVQEVRRRREEISGLKGNFSKVKIHLAGKSFSGAEVAAPDAANLPKEQATVIGEKETKAQEAQDLCNKRNKGSDLVVKSCIEQVLKLKMAQIVKEETDSKRKEQQHASLKNLYSDGERAVIIDKAALERASLEEGNKPHKPFSDMKFAKPKSTNKEFLNLVNQLSSQLVLRTSVEPKERLSVERLPPVPPPLPTFSSTRHAGLMFSPDGQTAAAEKQSSQADAVDVKPHQVKVTV